MLIDLRKLLSGTEDELTVSACLDMDKFDDGLNSYEAVRCASGCCSQR